MFFVGNLTAFNVVGIFDQHRITSITLYTRLEPRLDYICPFACIYYRISIVTLLPYNIEYRDSEILFPGGGQRLLNASWFARSSVYNRRAIKLSNEGRTV